ncbi:unnamed protein product [Schistosoma margrebowiei]|uniref:Uncharacterized protein n=1 Tax=Schistosoma margrebowiei TaxID=48269 RepID=A0A183LW54_9TREM|nr:unnamed protein product [Schistosoma margrebowiei]
MPNPPPLFRLGTGSSPRKEELENVKTFTYTVNIIDEQDGSDADVKARIGKARAVYLQLKNIWKSK